MEIKVVVADDHSLLREGLANLLRETHHVNVVGEACDGVEAVEQVGRLSPDVILMDLNMPRQDGVTATRIITEEYPLTKVVVLTVSESDDDLFAAVLAGAKGYLLKNSRIEDVVRGIEAAAAGEALLSTPIAAKMLDRVRQDHGNAAHSHAHMPVRTCPTCADSPRKRQSPREIAAALEIAERAIQGRPWMMNELTRREREVLGLLVEGASTKAVADTLCISQPTARHHIDNIISKLGVHSRLEAVAYAVRELQPS